jgi:Tfp pilus assembly protein PilX
MVRRYWVNLKGRKSKIDTIFTAGENDQGGALVTAVLVLVLLFVLGTAMLSVTATERTIAWNQTQATKAFYLAESGIQLALEKLRSNDAWRDGFSNIPLGEGRIVVVTVTEEGTNLHLQCVAEVGSYTKTIRTTVPKLLISGSQGDI